MMNFGQNDEGAAKSNKTKAKQPKLRLDVSTQQEDGNGSGQSHRSCGGHDASLDNDGDSSRNNIASTVPTISPLSMDLTPRAEQNVFNAFGQQSAEDDASGEGVNARPIAIAYQPVLTLAGNTTSSNNMPQAHAQYDVGGSRGINSTDSSRNRDMNIKTDWKTETHPASDGIINSHSSIGDASGAQLQKLSVPFQGLSASSTAAEPALKRGRHQFDGTINNSSGGVGETYAFRNSESRPAYRETLLSSVPDLPTTTLTTTTSGRRFGSTNYYRAEGTRISRSSSGSGGGGNSNSPIGVLTSSPSESDSKLHSECACSDRAPSEDGSGVVDATNAANSSSSMTSVMALAAATATSKAPSLVTTEELLANLDLGETDAEWFLEVLEQYQYGQLDSQDRARLEQSKLRDKRKHRHAIPFWEDAGFVARAADQAQERRLSAARGIKPPPGDRQQVRLACVEVVSAYRASLDRSAKSGCLWSALMNRVKYQLEAFGYEARITQSKTKTLELTLFVDEYAISRSNLRKVILECLSDV